MNHFIQFVIPLLMAFSYRARGGAIPLGSDTLGRLIFGAIPIGLISTYVCYVHGLPLWLATMCSITAFGADSLGHASEQGKIIKQNEEMGGLMALMLLIYILPLEIYAAIYHIAFYPVIVVPLGLLGGLGYNLGYRIPFQLRTFGLVWCQPIVKNEQTVDWSELLGAALAFGVPLAILAV